MDKLPIYRRQIADFSLDGVFVAALYDEDMQRKIHRFKFVHNRVDRVYFESLFSLLYEQNMTDFDVIIYPPVSLRDRILRGPNHAKRLAQLFPNPQKKPTFCPFSKSFFAGHQSRRHKQERQKIMIEFTLLPKFHSQLVGKNILLVDDLITTGWTAQTLCDLVKSAGARSVVGYFLASEKV